MADGWTVAQAMAGAAVLLSAGTLFFSSLGILAERDFFLLLGLVACVAGCAAFAFYLWEQGVQGEYTDALVANFVCLALLALYAIGCQFEGWRARGLDSGEEGEEEEGEAGGGAEVEGAAAQAQREGLIKRK